MFELAEKPHTLDEYLEFEERALERHEFRAGKLVEVPDSTEPHSLIEGNFGSAILTAQKGRSVRNPVCMVQMKVGIPPANRTVYPDIVAWRSKPEFWKGREEIIINPMLVAEVFSPGTEQYDRGGKFDLYRMLPSFEEYVLVEQDKPSVEVWHLDDPETGHWSSFKVEGMDASFYLQSVDCQIFLSDVYDLVDF